LASTNFQNRDVHTGYYFLDDMGTWLAGSPTTTSFDRGMRNTCRLLREAAYPARGFASHRPQIINKSLVNEIYGRFIVDADHAWHDEWSLYFNVACQLYPRRFRAVPTGTLGWPMRPGDWLPEILPTDPAFENYAPDGMFAGLSLPAATARPRSIGPLQRSHAPAMRSSKDRARTRQGCSGSW
jgi:hypothetical protein